MDSVFIFKPEREANTFRYVPYFNMDNDNIEYESFNIEKKLEKLGSSRFSDIMCQANVTNDFVRGALGFSEKEFYDEYDSDDDSISVHDSDKGVDILIVWTDIKQQQSSIGGESKRRANLESLRGVAGLYIRTDKNGDRYAEVAIICNAPGTARKTRKANIKKRGKEILKLIDELAKGENVKYIALKALDTVVTYYHKFGYKLVQNPYDRETPRTIKYVEKLVRVKKEIDKINARKSRDGDRKKNREKQLTKLHREKDMMMAYLNKFVVGLHNVNEMTNFKYDPDDEPYSDSETYIDYMESAVDDGYRMYKPIVRREVKATRKKRKRKQKKRTKKKTLKNRN